MAVAASSRCRIISARKCLTSPRHAPTSPSSANSSLASAWGVTSAATPNKSEPHVEINAGRYICHVDLSRLHPIQLLSVCAVKFNMRSNCDMPTSLSTCQIHPNAILTKAGQDHARKPEWESRLPTQQQNSGLRQALVSSQATCFAVPAYGKH